ncbi:MFS transporter [Bordetella sputigena]|uniref:MFS transporter n=1 Tax=Bordetella sputigena TaxID=1416810 RepID=UPI0039EEAC28
MATGAGATYHPFFGSKVVAATFVVAVFGWGVGFYGPPVYLQDVLRRGVADVAMASAAVTFHFVLGAFVVANLPRLYRRFGVPRITVLGAALLALGVHGWAIAATPAQLFVAAAFSGAGWVAMGAAAVNALIAPWYALRRPAALGMAYNGASMGGVLFSPLWVLLIDRMGFSGAAAAVGIVMVAIVAFLSGGVFRHTPASKGQRVDGLVEPAATTATAANGAETTAPLPLASAWRDRRFITLCAGMALGLFAQIGLIAHLFSILAPAMGEQTAGAAMGLCTACAILGRYAVGRLMPVDADRRRVAALAYGLQTLGVLVLLASAALRGHGWPADALCWTGLVLFGSGIGNATSLPPLIAQVDFLPGDARKVIPLIVAISQATYAFAPAAFGLLRTNGGVTALYCVAALAQLAAIASLMLGRRLARHTS